MSVVRRLAIVALSVSGVLAVAAAAQTSRPAPSGGDDADPAAEGIDLKGSDPEAIAIADRVMEALGGRDAWDRTRHLAWNWFGREFYVWDKQTGAVRIEAEDPRTGEPVLVLLDVGDMTGQMWRGTEEITDPAELADMLEQGKARWINAAYWMFMPYKLKDSGVSLRYLGPGTTEAGAASDVLELTFDGVGVTPGNKYHVHVGRASDLVEQWSFFRDAADPHPRFTGPWANWKQHGDILLSDDRGAQGRHTDLGVYDELPETVYTRAVPTGLPNTARARRQRFAAGIDRLGWLLGSWRCSLMRAQPDEPPQRLSMRWETDWAFNRTHVRIEMHLPTLPRAGFADPALNRVIYVTYDPDADEYVVTRQTPGTDPETPGALDEPPLLQRGGFGSDDLLELHAMSSGDAGASPGPRTEIRIYDERRFTLTDFRFDPAADDWRPVDSYLLTRPRAEAGATEPE